MEKPKYQRIIIKISGEALGGENGSGIDNAMVNYVVEQIKRVSEMGVQNGIIVGGGNF